MIGAMPFILGLTGSIGMGKSATSAHFRESGVPVFDADDTVARLYAGAAAPLIEAAFPGTSREGVVDRDALSAMVLGHPSAIKQLEAIVHPMVRNEERAFVNMASGAGARLAVLDIPLLLETRGEGRCDAVVVVSAPHAVQRRRVLARPGMTQEKLAAILARQMPDDEKRRRAHFLIDTSRGHADARFQVQGILRALAGRPTRQFSLIDGRDHA